jgi:hypothetical protein
MGVKPNPTIGTDGQNGFQGGIYPKSWTTS